MVSCVPRSWCSEHWHSKEKRFIKETMLLYMIYYWGYVVVKLAWIWWHARETKGRRGRRHYRRSTTERRERGALNVCCERGRDFEACFRLSGSHVCFGYMGEQRGARGREVLMRGISVSASCLSDSKFLFIRFSLSLLFFFLSRFVLLTPGTGNWPTHDP